MTACGRWACVAVHSADICAPTLSQHCANEQRKTAKPTWLTGVCLITAGRHKIVRRTRYKREATNYYNRLSQTKRKAGREGLPTAPLCGDARSIVRTIFSVVNFPAVSASHGLIFGRAYAQSHVKAIVVVTFETGVWLTPRRPDCKWLLPQPKSLSYCELTNAIGVAVEVQVAPRHVACVCLETVFLQGPELLPLGSSPHLATNTPQTHMLTMPRNPAQLEHHRQHKGRCSSRTYARRGDVVT